MTEIDPWEVAKVAAEDHYLPRMDGTVAPDHVQQAFTDGYAGTVERLPSRDEIAREIDAAIYASINPVLNRGSWKAAQRATEAILALIRERYEGES